MRCLLYTSDIDFCFLRRTLSNHYDSESERHPEVICAVVVVGIAVVVDIAGIGINWLLYDIEKPTIYKENDTNNNSNTVR